MELVCVSVGDGRGAWVHDTDDSDVDVVHGSGGGDDDVGTVVFFLCDAFLVGRVLRDGGLKFHEHTRGFSQLGERAADVVVA